MPSISPVPQSGASPVPPLERHLPISPPVASATPEPANAGGTHTADLGDYITLGIGLAGIGALTVASAGGLEAVAAGGAIIAKNAGTAAKAFGPQLAEDWKAGAERLKSASGVGRVAAEQTTAALTDYARSAVVGAGVSAGAALAQHAVRAVMPHPVESKSQTICRPKP